METTKHFFKKNFSSDRLERYFILYPDDESLAIRHYEANIRLSEACYVCLSVLEVSLRNALIRELERHTGRKDWYEAFMASEKMKETHKYIVQTQKHLADRGEAITPAKMNAEFTLGFWVSLLNSDYERILWKDLRRAFPHMPKPIRKRKNVSAPLNRMRRFRNRVFHNEPICWHLEYVESFHCQLLEVLSWIDEDLPAWEKTMDRFDAVCELIRKELGWHKK